MEELIPPPTAKELLKKEGESSLVDRQKFFIATEWLKGTIPNHDGSQLTIVEAYKKAFQFSIDEMEEKINESIKKIKASSLDDPPLDHINKDLVNRKLENTELDAENHSILLDWFFQIYPRGHSNWYKVITVMRKYLETRPMPSLCDQVKHLRDLYFNDTLLPAKFWNTLITNAYKDPQDLIMPLDVLRKVKGTDSAKKLGLQDQKGNYVMKFSDSMTFDEFLNYLPQEYSQRVNTYLLILDWLLTFPNWRKERTLGQLARYQARNNPKTPWGEQIFWQDTIRLRRLLDSWTVKTPDVVYPYIELLDEEKLNEILKSEPEHILEKNKNMIPWFIAVHNKAYELKNTKTKVAKKRTTPTESFDNQPSQCEYATMYLPWVTLENTSNYSNSKYTILEAVEIAYYGRTHKIPPNMTTEEFENRFKSRLADLESAKNEIKEFPKNLRWSKAVQDQLLHKLQRDQQYAKAYGIMYSIYLNQQNIIERNKWIEENKRRADANQSSLTFEEWKTLPIGGNDNYQVSWFTGDRIEPGEWHMVPVENTYSKNYRKIMALKGRMMKDWKASNSTDNADTEYICKCALCGKDGPMSQFDTINIHKKHHKAFYSYAERYKRKHGVEKVQDDAIAPATLMDAPMPNPINENNYKKKYETITATFRRWLYSDLPDADVREKLKTYVKKRKLEIGSVEMAFNPHTAMDK